MFEKLRYKIMKFFALHKAKELEQEELPTMEHVEEEHHQFEQEALSMKPLILKKESKAKSKKKPAAKKKPKAKKTTKKSTKKKTPKKNVVKKKPPKKVTKKKPAKKTRKAKKK